MLNLMPFTSIITIMYQWQEPLKSLRIFLDIGFQKQ
jgi:hypothetical protein